MRLLIALLSLFALTLVPTVSATAFAAAHAAQCGEHHGKASHDRTMTDCVAKCCTSAPAATPTDPERPGEPAVRPTPAYVTTPAAIARGVPIPYEPPPPRHS